MNNNCFNCGKSFYVRPSRPDIKLCSAHCRKQCYHDIRICVECGREFSIEKNRDDKFCTLACYNAHRLRNKRIEEKTCPTCGKTFVVDRHKRWEQKYCSKECAGVSKQNEYRVCLRCGKVFSIRCKSSITRFCSVSCSRKNFKYTLPELSLYDFLDHYNFSYEKQKSFGRIAPDAFIQNINLAIFVDGEYWHGTDKVIQKDTRVTGVLQSKGINVIRLDTCNNKVDFIPLVEYLGIG